MIFFGFGCRVSEAGEARFAGRARSARRPTADASKGTFETLTVPKVPFGTRDRQPKHRRSMP
jgi:hypothetical protein